MSGRMLLTAIVLVGSLALAATAQAADIPGELSPILTKSDDDVGSALEDLRKDVAKGGSSADWRDLAIAQCRAGLYAEAVKSFQRVTGQDGPDFWRQVFHGLALQESGQGVAAAAQYAQAALMDTKLAGALAARADLLRAQSLVLPVDPEAGLPEAARTVAVMPPRDLGANAAELVGPLGTVVAAALAANPEVSVLWPSDVEAWLAHDGRSPADLDDDARKDRIARTMARRGVDALLTTSFLRTETGEMHLRQVLLPVSADGLGTTVSLTSGMGTAGQEFAPLEAPVRETWNALGAADGGVSGAFVIASQSGAQQAHEALSALRAGNFAAAKAGVCAARTQHPEVASLTQWCGVLTQAADTAGADVLAQASSPAALTAELRDLALSERKKKRRFDDF